jgi:retinol dehydrogenase 12
MNKIAIITGANSGLGLVTAKNLVANSFDLVLVIRNAAKGEIAKDELLKINPKAKIEIQIADLSDLEQVKIVANKIKDKYPIIDRLINNAGYSADAIEFVDTGYEKSFVANHLGHFVLTNILIDNLKASKDARIINVSSAAHALGKFSRMFEKNSKNLSLIQSYADGKLANILFAKGLKLILKGTNVLTFSLHPGVVKTNFGANYTGFFSFGLALMKPFMISSEKGAETSIYLATTLKSNLINNNGMYFDKSKVKNIYHKDITTDNIELFWQKSLAACKGLF